MMNAAITRAKPWVCSRCALSLLRQSPRAFVQSRQQHSSPYGDNARRKPFRMAVIGSGPAGFYTASKVISHIEGAKVDMYEQLPVPYGLVRFGVAPDHPSVKNCQDLFEGYAEDNKGFNFIGNISIGDEPGQLPLSTIVPHYDAILFAYGASKDRTLGVPGEGLKGIHSARAFVGWYNGLPEYADLTPDLTNAEEAVIIGQGNVAMDVARILLQDLSILKPTDITEHAIQTLAKSRVKRVRIVGRRGPVQAAFTIKEVRELVKLKDAYFHPVDPALIPIDIPSLPRVSRRVMELLAKAGAQPDPTSAAKKSVSLDFCLSPSKFTPRANSDTQLGGISFERTTLNPNAFDPAASVLPTGEFIDLPADIAFRSIGYKSEALDGFADLGLPFDNRKGIIPNDGSGGRVSNSPGMYCAGWVKRGPTGVIASTMGDAFETANAIVEDWNSSVAFLNDGSEVSGGWDAIKAVAENRGCRRVSWDDWRKIDAVELANGKKKGKVREKFTRIEEMLAVLD